MFFTRKQVLAAKLKKAAGLTATAILFAIITLAMFVIA